MMLVTRHGDNEDEDRSHLNLQVQIDRNRGERRVEKRQYEKVICFKRKNYPKNVNPRKMRGSADSKNGHQSLVIHSVCPKLLFCHKASSGITLVPTTVVI
ncbi:hypothetical protein GWI33_010629 [Rhynchophorus ferrugineus]|uniref:Uncharacterized protein n=1 Tax=Rhynchophorus ferrugineus TaxID=354439 RepID=A0A834IUS3_RHYFE|nr:hypothetical protein GWI33_010629 [Rhynchophorus ferrugineus]